MNRLSVLKELADVGTTESQVLDAEGHIFITIDATVLGTWRVGQLHCLLIFKSSVFFCFKLL